MAAGKEEGKLKEEGQGRRKGQGGRGIQTGHTMVVDDRDGGQ